MISERRGPTAYEILGVHPTAPVDLVSSCYWNLAKELQARRGNDHRMDLVLHHVMKAYETVSDSAKRAEYDASIGHKDEPLSKRRFKPAKRSGFGALLGRKSKLHIQADPYEVMGLHPNALPASIRDAHRIMKDQYLRLPPESRRRVQLMRMLDESYAVLSDPDKRAQYDEEVARVEVPEPPKPLNVPLIYDDEPEAAAEEPVAVVEAVPEPEEDTPTAAAAKEAAAATAVATAETRAAKEHLETAARAENGQIPDAGQPGAVARATHGLGAVGASVLRIAHVRGKSEVDADEPVKPKPAPVQRPAQPQVERPDVEAVLLGRLAASVEELATSVRELTSTVREPDQENGESRKDPAG